MLSSLLSLSPWALILGVVISATSVIEAFGTGKTVKERIFKCLTAALTIALLLIQAIANKRASSDAQTALNDALQKQRQQLTQDLTSAFTTGTNQIIKLSGQEADKTRKAANDQTSAIEGQVANEETTLQRATLGTDSCPAVVASIENSGRPHALIIFNTDKQANMYGVIMHLIEYAPEADGIWRKIIQQQTLKVDDIPPERAVTLMPFQVLSREKTAYFQVDALTRAVTCNGSLRLRDDGGDTWRNESSPIYKNGKLQFDGGDHKLSGHVGLIKP
jgi:ABC-type phosphate transport system auxiliary subunit